MDKDYIKLTKESEMSFFELFSSYYIDKRLKGIKRLYDKEIKDMYDHNFSLLEGEINEDTYKILEEIKTSLNEPHIKISSSNEEPYLLTKGFEQEILLTMLKTDYQNFDIPNKIEVTYKNLREHPEYIKDIIDIEHTYYGHVYGNDFINRRYKRYLDKIQEGDNGLNMWVVIYQEKVIAHCYTYYDKNVVAIDGLIVIKEARNKYVASNLFKYIASYYKCPLYLHADEEETPKELYSKLGFKTIYKSFDYLKVDKK